MGTITISDLDEVRKFKDEGLYASNETVKGIFMGKIQRLDYAELLRR